MRSFLTRFSSSRPGRLFCGAGLAVGLLVAPVSADDRLRLVSVQDISIVSKNVFDPSVPGENYWIYRVANYLHFRTRLFVIRRELLFKPGDTVPQELLDESERNLRALPFIKSAQVRTLPAAGGKVNVNVTTQDSWTTQPQLNFATEGGQSRFGAGFIEENVLGYGKTFSYFYRENPDSGNGFEYGYNDPQLLGSRWRLDSFALDQASGNQQRLNVERPFYSLGTRGAGGVFWRRNFGTTKVFQNGTQTNQYDLDHLDLDAYGGLRANSDLLNIHRLYLRYRYSQDIYLPESTTGTLPQNRAFSGPVLQWSLNQSRFIKETFVDRAGRVEDINLGHVAGLSAQYSARTFGATGNEVPFAIYDNCGWGGAGNSFGLAGVGMSGRYATYAPAQVGGRLEHTLYFLTSSLYRHLLENPVVTGVAHLEAAYVQNSDFENPLSLGGNNGLRGFKVNKFTGNKDLLVNLETRSFYGTELFHLAYVGGAVFVDAGQAQPAGLGFTEKDFHASVGAGLRIAVSRSTVGTVYRFDVAYAVGPVQGDPRVVVSITAGPGFQRTANTFSGFPDIQTSN